MRIKAIDKNVVIKPLEESNEEVTKGGIILTNNTKDDTPKGEVLSAGHMTTELRPKDVVFYNKALAKRVVVDNVAYFVVKEEDIYCKIGKSAKEQLVQHSQCKKESL